jgi:glycosyltransferase involved in cell wall biosynthesis
MLARGDDEPLSILLTVHHDLERTAGAAGSTLALADRLVQRGHRVDVVGLDALSHRRGALLDAVAFPHRVTAIVSDRLGRGDVDVVDASSGDLAYFAPRHVRATSAAVFSRSHGLEQLASARRREGARAGELALRVRYRAYHGGFRLREVARSLRAADGVLLLNQAEDDYARDTLGIQATRIWRTAPLLGDVDVPTPRSPARDVLVLGDASWRKGGDVAIRVIATLLLADATRTASWHGLADPAATAREFPDDLRDRVQCAGPYGRDALGELLSSHTVLLMASRSEGLPLTLLEALRAHIAVVGSDVPGVRDLLASGAGVLVPEGHVEGMTAAVRLLLESPERRGACRAAAVDVVARYGPEHVLDELLSAYRTVLDVKRPPR